MTDPGSAVTVILIVVFVAALAEPFNSRILLRGDGTPRPAWDVWSGNK